MTDCEWIYEYKLRTPWFRIAFLKTKFLLLNEYADTKRVYIEYRKNGQWTSRSFL